MDFHYIEDVPQPLIWGHEAARLSLEITHSGTQLLRCENNNNLFLSSLNAPGGVFRASSFLAALCREYCRPNRADAEVCPAFIGGEPSYARGDFESAPLPAAPRFHLCGGVEYLMAHCQTHHEKVFLESWLQLAAREGASTRQLIAMRWPGDVGWIEPMLIGCESRRDAYEEIMWQTIPGPALIPQVWINVLPRGHKLHGKVPQRLDFVAYCGKQLHAIEIDGDDHFCDCVVTDAGPAYKLDDRAYERTLRQTRYLESLGWAVCRVGHAGVRDLQVNTKLKPSEAATDIQRRTGMCFGAPDIEDAERLLGELYDHYDVW